jgi:membrane-bound ClpP family serine protease
MTLIAAIEPNFMWAILLLLLGLLCMVLELFIPSGGILGLLSALCLIAALVMSFMAGSWYGLTMTFALTLLVPLSLFSMIKLWPKTPLGSKIVLAKPTTEEVLPQTEDYLERDSLFGQTGFAKNDMLPGGVVMINGKSYDAISNGMPIDARTPVRVIGFDTRRLIVTAEKGTLPPTHSNAPPTTEIPGIEDPFA